MPRSVADCAEAYVRARYGLTLADGTEAPLPLGRPAPALARAMAETGARTAAFITAWNPGSVERPEAENQAAQDRLKAAIAAAGGHWLPAEGRDPDGGWASEPSLIALGLDFATACALGDDFGQNAILFAGPDAILRLVFCRLGRDDSEGPNPAACRRCR